MFARVILIVLDSVGIGELPDAPLYEDQGSNTLGNVARHAKASLMESDALEHVPDCSTPRTP